MVSSSFPSGDKGTPKTAGALAPKPDTKGGEWVRRVVAAVLIITGLATVAYSGLSIYVATQLAHQAPIALQATPASLGLQFRDVSFTSREDHLALKGWFIPGVLPDGKLIAVRAIIMVHGFHTNRVDPAAGLLELSGGFVRQGFAVLAFDLRGDGASAA